MSEYILSCKESCFSVLEVGIVKPEYFNFVSCKESSFFSFGGRDSKTRIFQFCFMLRKYS